MPTTRRILGVSGSLRAVSSHTQLLRDAAALCPRGAGLALYDGLASLPAFNPDHDAAEDLPAVQDWRRALRECSALLICTPEYAHGIPGALKNALDWVVGSGELVDKPVGLITATAFSREGSWLERSLLEILRTMNAKVVDGAVLNFPGLRGRKMDLQGAYDPAALASVLKALV
jgi:NAD(P)H-dependent FMN reductase